MSPPAACGLTTIPPGRSFVTSLIDGIVANWHDPDDPFCLARITILLPTRRAVRALRDGFRLWSETAHGTATLLPAIRPIGDADESDLSFAGPPLDDLELDPPIPPVRRQLLLAHLIQRWTAAKDGAPGPLPQAVRLAGDLSDFLDTVQTDDADLSGLADLAPDRFAAHWQQTIDFLTIVTDFWPEMLRETAVSDMAVRRNRLLDAQSAAWRAHPPTDPVIAAGSTGSIPATARLLDAILTLPQGAVVLPGLDRAMDPESWAAVAGEPSHPQYGLHQLLTRLGRSRDDVRPWPGTETDTLRTPRTDLINEALRPAKTTHDWMSVKDRIIPEAAAGLTRIDAPTPALEARTIAVIMRETLEIPNATAALVTPDRGLARRVVRDLHRWGIDVDDSAGMPLSLTPPAVFLGLIKTIALERFAPVPLLALLKHPLTRLGFTRARLDALTARLERDVLRGLRPRPGLEGLRLAIAERCKDEERAAPLTALADRLGDAFAPFTATITNDTADLAAFAAAHGETAERIAEDPDSETSALWSGDAGEALAAYLQDLLNDGRDGMALRLTDYAALFSLLMDTRMVRARTPRHPRLHIWGPLEARLQQADTMILGGLNEGTWPAEPGIDPWLNRPMRAALGLAMPERRIGQAAHDFAQMAAAPKVIMTRAEKSGGAPQVASRWLLRLANLLEGAGLTDALTPATDYTALADRLNHRHPPHRIAEPTPRPPVEARPTELPVTDIGKLIRDPYAVYARRILRLRPLDDLDRQPGPQERGTLVHDILEGFIRDHTGPLTDDALDDVMARARTAFAPLLDRPGIAAFWWPRFAQAMTWFIAKERSWRMHATPAALEAKGMLRLPLSHAFTLTARADRIDRLDDASYAVLDYKTGAAPSGAQVETGLEPQLPLEALILEQGGFEGLDPAPVSVLRYVRLRGGREPGEIREPVKPGAPVTELIAETADGLNLLIETFKDPNTPYRSKPRAQFQSAYGDYDHLARYKEWSVYTGGEDG